MRRNPVCVAFRRIGDIVWRSALRGVNGADLPATQDGIGHGVGAVQESPSLAERQFVDQRGDVGDGQVVVRLRARGVGFEGG